MYGQQQAGQGSNLRYTEEEKVISNRGFDIKRAPWLPGKLLEGLVLWVSNHCKGQIFLLMIKHTGVILVLGLEQ